MKLSEIVKLLPDLNAFLPELHRYVSSNSLRMDVLEITRNHADLKDGQQFMVIEHAEDSVLYYFDVGIECLTADFDWDACEFTGLNTAKQTEWQTLFKAD